MLSFKTKHFLTGEELSQNELLSLIDSAALLHRQRASKSISPLKGKTFALVFEKPSVRTRVSFSVSILELGGNVIELVSGQTKFEEPEDSIRVLQGMVQGVMQRTFNHSTLERMAAKATIPIINGLSDSHHPCQAIADLLTLYQNFNRLQGLKLAYVGDGNNVLHSLLLLAPYIGVDVHFCCPKGYEPDPAILARARQRALHGGASIKSFSTPAQAVAGTHAVYTDVWTSMGQAESAERSKAFAGFQLNGELFAKALPDAVAMHCLPMIKGQEITEEIVEHPRSVLFQQAENRVHAQKALLIGLYQAKQKSVAKELSYSHVL